MRRRKPDPVKGRNLAAILAGFKAGVADDAELWTEFETFFGDGTRRRWRATGGPEFRTWARRTTEADDHLEALLDPALPTRRTPTRKPSTIYQVPAEHRALSVAEEHAFDAQERREQHEREEAQRAAHRVEQAREEAEHAERLARFARYRDNAQTTVDEDLHASLMSLIDGGAA
jgi:hypothetical protein